MDELEALVRELARDPRALTYKDMAIVIRAYPELVGEAIGNAYEPVAKTLEFETGVIPYLGALVATHIHDACKEYLRNDIEVMRSQIDIEDRDDDEYTHREAV